MFRRTSMIVGTLGLPACAGSDADLVDLASDRIPVDDGDDDDDDSVSADSTAPDDGVFDIYYLQVDATFGWDNETRSVVGVATAYGEIPPAITISLGEKSWRRDDFSSDSEHYCIIVLPLTTPVAVPYWVGNDPSLYFGFDYAGEAPLTDCGTPGYEYDLGLWPEDLSRAFADNDWGIAIGDMRPEYEANFATSILLPHLVGARVNNTLIQTSGNEGVLGYVAVASRIDAGHRLLVEPDGRQPMIPSEEIAVPTGIATGLYQLLPLYIFTFGP